MRHTIRVEVRVAERSREDGNLKERRVSLHDLRDAGLLRQLEPIRVVRAVRLMQSRARYQPVTSLGDVVVCESRLEAFRVMELDRLGTLAWIVAQPFRLHVFENGRLARRHTPDLLYGLRDGSVVLENVRPPHKRKARFLASEDLCRRTVRSLGWSYATVGGYVGAEASVLHYLWSYASTEPRGDVVRRVVAAFREQGTWRLQELVARCGRAEYSYPSIMALVWRGDLTIPMHVEIDAWTPVRMTSGGAA